jgi:HJR/Mrr/RecB family endonuclease
MTEMELLKVVIRRLAKLEKSIIKQDDLYDISEQLDEQADALRDLHATLAEFKGAVDSHHMENVNSDDMLLRSILHQTADK